MPPIESEFAQQIKLAWQGKLNLTDLVSFAERLQAAGELELAAVLYQTWLARNHTPANHLVYFNYGVRLSELENLDAAKDAYLQAIGLSPSFLQPHVNLGNVYERLGQFKPAIAEWSWVAENASAEKPDERALRLLALNNLGRALENEHCYGEALERLTESLRLEPNQPDVLHHWIFLRARQCEWPIYAPIEGVDPDLMQRSTSALEMISLSDDPAMQLNAATNYVTKKVNCNVPALSAPSSYGHEKIRVAYLSSDFCLHAVALLTAELFELHDRQKFEVYGFCWSREDGSALRQRIVRSMDYFFKIGELTDEAAAKLIREQEIDILVDLHGQTRGARPGLLAYRPAPIQITYLGLPATTGFPFIDYAIVDRFLMPEEFAPYYTEKPLYMPDIYQVSDRKRSSVPAPTREACGLPHEGFVFCSFNNNYKFTPEMFTVWMNILRRTPGSVFWLLADNPRAEANLRKEVAARGMDGQRLIFASRVAPEAYLARYEVADLFLDSFPFNAGTTANDALWMGLPLLTCAGRTFASRMAGALLTAAGLPELITYDLAAYEEKAVALANTPQECQRLRRHLQQNRESSVLFDTPRFTRHLEAHFRQLVDNLAVPESPVACHRGKAMDWLDTPIFIINFNNLDRGFQRLIEWLQKAGHENITVIDNASTWPPLLEYYVTLRGVTVERVGQNMGHEAPWILGIQNRQNTRYIVSDPDVVPDAGCPLDLVRKMHEVADRLGPAKVGPAIRTDNLPDHYPFKQMMLKWESKYWHPSCRVDADCWRALIDTTFALYEPGMAHWPPLPHYRLDFPYVVEHIPWHDDLSQQNPERDFFNEHAIKGVSHASFGLGDLLQ